MVAQELAARGCFALGALISVPAGAEHVVQRIVAFCAAGLPGTRGRQLQH